MKFFANLKSNHTRESFKAYADTLQKAFDKYDIKDEVVVFPPFSAFLKQNFSFKQGAQNFYPAKNGSFTGEICKDMLDEFGVKTVLVGHSERRFLGESDLFLKSKFDFAKENGLDIVYCIGESDIVYMNNSTKRLLKSQLDNIDLEYENLTIAYEPVWAIGSGKSASGEYISEIFEFLNEYILDTTSKEVSLIYGGSATKTNIKEILSAKNCSGVLVGSFSWEAENFISLIKENL